MSKVLAGFEGNTGAFIAGGGMIAALILGAYIAFGREDITPQVQEAVVVAPATEVQTSQPAPEAATPEVPAVQTPSFDEVRREADGTTIIAGRAEPDSEVTIVVDGAPVTTAQTDSTGGFAAIASLPSTQSPQIIGLSARANETVTASVDEIILAPFTATPELTRAPDQIVTPATADAPELQSTSVAEAPSAVAQEDAPADVAVLKSDEDGVRLLAPTSPAPLTAVALDTIGYSGVGEVQLAGRAQPETAKVRVYLDNRSVISLPVDAQGRWQGDLPDVDEGVYTLRVDALTPEGEVSSRVETPFKRESAQTLVEASAGANGPVTSITVQTGATLWAIARDRYGDGTLFVRVFAANADAIRNPDLIYPGQVFDLPN